MAARRSRKLSDPRRTPTQTEVSISSESELTTSHFDRYGVVRDLHPNQRRKIRECPLATREYRQLGEVRIQRCFYCWGGCNAALLQRRVRRADQYWFCSWGHTIHTPYTSHVHLYANFRQNDREFPATCGSRLLEGSSSAKITRCIDRTAATATGLSWPNKTSSRYPQGCSRHRHLISSVTRLILVKAREVNKRISDLGGSVVRQRGSHRLFRAVKMSPEGAVVQVQTTVPQHSA